MRYVPYVVALLFLEIFFLVSCRGDETPPPPPTLTPTRTLVPSATLPPPTATDTPYPTETSTQRPPTNTLSATQTQTWPETPTLTPTITRTPTRTPTGQPTPTVTGTPPTATLTPTITNTPSGSVTPTGTPTPSPSPVSATEPLLWINPPDKTINHVGESAQVLVTTSYITNVYGIDLTLIYSPTLLTVTDLVPTSSGVQVLPGTCPQASIIQDNNVDLDEGQIDYEVSQVAPTLPCEGGVVIIIEFKCRAAGTSDLSFDASFIASIDDEIVHDIQDGTITCQP